jgi:Tfp pilus assembly protein PilE
MKRQAGFTLVDLIVIALVFGILAHAMLTSTR